MDKKTKNIVTHKSPDLDSCVAIWLLKNFVLEDYSFKYIFVDVGVQLTEVENCIHVDTGGVDYDHHDTDELVSAASLVYTKNKLNDKALKKIVDYTILVDHGITLMDNIHFMHLSFALNGLLGLDSERTLQAVLVILDGIYSSLLNEIRAEEEFITGIRFESVLGSGMAFNTENPILRKKVYKNGFSIFLFKDSKTGYAGFKATAKSNVDFTKLFHEVSIKEPNADWFLHSSNELLLCGSSKAPQKKLTQLSLQQLLSIIKKHA